MGLGKTSGGVDRGFAWEVRELGHPCYFRIDVLDKLRKMESNFKSVFRVIWQGICRPSQQ